MPTDITRITELIKSFKSETREEAVTVQVLGNLLQQIANVIGTTAQQTELTPVSNFYANLTSLNRILTGISAGTDDPNQMHLTLYDCSLKTGEITSLRDALVLRAATTDRAESCSHNTFKTSTNAKTQRRKYLRYRELYAICKPTITRFRP